MKRALVAVGLVTVFGCGNDDDPMSSVSWLGAKAERKSCYQTKELDSDVYRQCMAQRLFDSLVFCNESREERAIIKGFIEIILSGRLGRGREATRYLVKNGWKGEVILWAQPQCFLELEKKILDVEFRATINWINPEKLESDMQANCTIRNTCP